MLGVSAHRNSSPVSSSPCKQAFQQRDLLFYDLSNSLSCEFTMPEPTPFHLTALDHQLLAMTDEEYVPHDWADLRDIIGERSNFSNI